MGERARLPSWASRGLARAVTEFGNGPFFWAREAICSNGVLVGQPSSGEC
jgi:hypothetical protein